MIGISVLAVIIAVVAVSFECEVATLVFLGLAVGVARYSLTWCEGACGGLVGDTCVNGSPFSRVPFPGISRFCASQMSSKAHGCCSATRR
jgi:hypothetical protein